MRSGEGRGFTSVFVLGKQKHTLLSDAVDGRYCPINFEYVTTMTDKRKLEGDADKSMGRCVKRRREDREFAMAMEGLADS